MRHFICLVSFLALTACSPRVSNGVTVSPSLYEMKEGALAQVPGEFDESKVEEVTRLIAPYKAQLDDKMNRVLAQVVTPLKKGSPESNLGNWMADIMQRAATDHFSDREIAFAATNIGGLRVSEIGSGPLLVAEIYELMPFDNQLVVLELTGAEVKAFVNHIVNAGGWPVSEELAVRRVNGKLFVSIRGRPLALDKTYSVATIDYVANGGSNSTMLKGKPQLASGLFLRDVLIEYAGRATEPIDVQSTGSRIRL